MNTFKHIINWLIWSAVVLVFVLMTLTHIPAFQEWLGGRVARAIGRQLGTEVAVGRVDLGFLNRIIVDDVVMKDREQRDMLKVGRLSLMFDFLPLTEGRIVVSSAQLFNAHAMLCRKDSAAQPNFQFVVDALSSDDSTSKSPLDLAVNSLIVRRSSVSYDQLDVLPSKDGTIDPKHLSVGGISAHIQLKSLAGDMLSLNVKRLAMKEKSGLTVSRMSLRLNKDSEGAQLCHFFLQLPRSSVTIDTLTCTADFSRLKETLHFRGELSDASITPNDLASLMPKLAIHKTPVKLKALFSGTLNDMELSRLDMYTADGSLSADVSGWVRGLQAKPAWRVRMEKLNVSADFFDLLKKDFAELPDVVGRLGDVSMAGDLGGHADGTTDANLLISAGVGRLKLNAEMSEDKFFKGHIDTDGIELGQLLDNENLGLLATKIDLNGSLRNVHAQGLISQLDVNGYSYHQISVDGNYQDGNVEGKLQVSDPYINADIDGRLIRSGKSYDVKLAGDISHFSPKALQLSSQWGNALFAAKINADFKATTLNDAEGNVGLRDFVMTDSALNYRIDSITLRSGYENDVHYLRFCGDMGEVDLNGHFDWGTLPQSVAGLVASKLPTLPGLPDEIQKANNDFNVSVRLNDTRWLKHLLNVDFILEKPLVLEASVNDFLHSLNITGSLSRFSYNGGQYEGGRVSVTSPGDTMRLDIGATRLSENDRRMDFRLHAKAANNTLGATVRWDNSEQEEAVSGELNTETIFYRNASGLSEAHINVLPSHAVMGKALWDITPGVVVFSGDRVSVNHLAAQHNSQHIIVDGVASKRSADSLVVDLKGVEVAYILDLVNFTAVSFAGEATGKAYVTQAFGQPDAWADLRVDGFLFENGRMGTLNAQARWNRQQRQIDIHAICNDGPDAMTYIDGYVSPPNNNIDLAIKGRGTYIDFVHTYSKSFLSNISGHATGDLRLVGPLGEMDLLGQLVVDGKATVTALGTTYVLSNDTVTFVHDDIQFNDVLARDRMQNEAVLNGAIHHRNLSKLTFDLAVKTDRLLAYDMEEKPGDLFYGTVLASGEVALQGRPGEVIINCNATPLAGTVFTYNAANPDAINDQSFITWKEKLNADENSVEGGSAEDAEVAERQIASDLHINFLVNTTTDATLRILMDSKTNDYITLAGSGVIRASYYNKGAFQMFGTYTVDHGTYGLTIQNIIKKNFVFQPGGTLTFGGAPFDANLNLQALYTVNGVSLSDLSIGNSFSNNTVRVNCLMNIMGQAGAPRVEFDLDMPTVNSEEKQMIRSVITSEQEMNQQVLYLLGIGRFYTQGANNAGAQQQYAQSELAMQSFLSGTLSTQINEVLSQVLKTSNWNFGANISTGNEGWHNAEYEGVISGRMLNNRLLINGQFGYRDNATQATPSFIGDFDIRYLLFHNGNLALKVYNQTNDRYFTRSSLNTQGIGLIMKKDFNGIGDLFRHRRKSDE